VKSAGKVAFGDTEAVIRSGNWHGNDTTWRMCLDLNKALLFGDVSGRLHPAAEQRKRYVTLVDGIIAGDGRGPMNPDPVACGVVLFGEDPVVVDTACATFMGFDVDRIPVVREAYRARGWPLTDVNRSAIEVLSDETIWNRPLDEIDPDHLFRFRPHFGWAGHIEARWRTTAPIAAV
jgi:hypothetical protein